MELQYYRDFFWAHQSRLAQVNTASDADGFFECSDGEEVASFVQGYETAMSAGSHRNIEAEAESLHEHYRGRIDALQHELRNEQLLRHNSEKRLLHAQEANHVLCKKLRRYAAVLEGRSGFLIPAIQMTLLESSEKIWRMKIEVEALKYLLLRAMDPPAPQATETMQNHPHDALPSRPPSGNVECNEVAARSKGARESLQAASLRFRLSSSITDILKNFLGATTIGSSATWFDQLRIEDQSTSIVEELRGAFSSQQVDSIAAEELCPSSGAASRLGVGLCRADEMMVQRCFEEDLMLKDNVVDTEPQNLEPSSDSLLIGQASSDVHFSSPIVSAQLQCAEVDVTSGEKPPFSPLVRDLMPELTSNDDGSSAHKTAQQLVAKFHNPSSASLCSFLKERATVPHALLLPTNTLARSALILDPLLAANQKLKSEVTAIRKEKEASDGRLQAVIGELARSKEFADKKAARMLDVLTNEYEKQLDAVIDASHSPSDLQVAQRCEKVASVPEASEDRLSAAVDELRKFEEIARLSKDPSLRGKMMRQMKELHGDIQSLMRRRD